MNRRRGRVLLIILGVLLPMTAAAEMSLYMDGIQYNRNPYASKFEVLPERGGEFRYTRVNSTGIPNLNYFWRGSIDGNYEYATYPTVSGSLHAGSIGFSLGGGLSYRLINRSHWGIEPFFGVFNVSRWRFTRNKHGNDWRIETGLAMDIPAKMKLIWLYTRGALLLGLNYDL